MSEISDQLHEIQNRVRSACRKAGRDGEAARLVAVSKTFPVEALLEAVAAGQEAFGESRLQEAEPKIEALPGTLEWHFIGRLQRNKVRRILPLFQFIHAIDSRKIADYTNEVAEDLGLYPKVFLQVNQAGEESKGGFTEAELREQLEAMLRLSHVEIIGLMTIPPAVEDPELSRPWFRELRKLRDELEKQFSIQLPCLSMGMSGDFEIAVEEGATHVRVGSAIFGKRAYRVAGELA